MRFSPPLTALRVSNRTPLLKLIDNGVGNSVDSITVITNDERADVEVSHLVCSKREHPDEDLAVLTLCEPLMFSKGINIDSKGLHLPTINTL